MSPRTRRTLQSGVPQLDVVLGGGIPSGDLFLIVGAPGSGKTTLVSQVAFHAARNGQNVLFVSTLSEPASRLVKHLHTLSFWDDSLLGRRVFFESIFPVVTRGIEPLVDALIASAQEHDASLVVLDGFAILRDLHPGSRELGTFVNQLAVAMAALGCTTLVTSSDVPDTRGANSPPEFTMSDSIVELSQSQAGERHRRTLRAWKVRGARPLLGPHAIRLSESGLSIFPRMSAPALSEQEPLSGKLASWGTAELDRACGGGLPSGSCTVVAGVSGSGKTVLALQYILEGARCGERALYVSFRESQHQLTRKAQTFQLELGAALASGDLAVLRLLPIDLEVDVVLHEIWSTLEQSGATRLVIDSLAELELALTEENKRGSLAAFKERLRLCGITVVLLCAISQQVGPELDFAHSPLEVFADNVVLLRHRALHDGIGRVVSVLKMREAAYDASPRQYRLGERGVQVLTKAESDAGLLRHITRLSSGGELPFSAAEPERG